MCCSRPGRRGINDTAHVTSTSDFEDGFPPAFFRDYVHDQARRAIAAMGDAGRVVPWVDAGRLPHSGDPMTAGIMSILEPGD